MDEMSTDDGEFEPEILYSAEEIGEFLGMSSRSVLLLPIRQYRLGPRTIRYRLSDVYRFIGLDNPND